MCLQSETRMRLARARNIFGIFVLFRTVIAAVLPTEKMRTFVDGKMTQNDSNEFRLPLSNKAFACISMLFCLWSADCTSTGYGEIVKLGSSCPELDSCAYLRTSPPRQRSQVKDRSCSCDPSCWEYGDCCVDAPPASKDVFRNGLNCLHVEQTGGAYMKDSCPPSFGGPERVRELCERGPRPGDNQADPLASTPVTDPISNRTYKNFYCNLCNSGDSPNDAVMWTPRLECPLLGLLNSSGSVTPRYVLENLATDGRGWGLHLDDEDGESFFHDCSVHPVVPTRLGKTVRACRADLVSECPSSWVGEEVRKKCESYSGARFDADGNGYRNVHCAICNGVHNASKLSCQPEEEVDIFRDLGTHSFAILLDISESTGETVGRVRVCKRGEVFDPFFKKCRGVSCLPGFVRRGRRCVLRSPVEFVKFYSNSSSSRRVSATSGYRRVGNATSGYYHSTPGYANATLPKT